MNKTILAVVVGLFVIGGVAVFAFINSDDKSQNMTAGTTHSDSENRSKQTASSPQPASDEVKEGKVNIDISNFEFKPSSIKVKKGSTVTWTNQDDTEHDVAPDSPSESFAGSELLAKGESYSYTFDAAGTYSYHCTPHPYMKASIEVVE
jgi:plastocyanin